MPASEVLRQVLLMVLLPLALGQALRYLRPAAMDAARPWFGALTSLCLLGVKWEGVKTHTAFYRAVQGHDRRRSAPVFATPSDTIKA